MMSQRQRAFPIRASVLAVAACFAAPAGALPNAPTVTAGQATINVQGKTLTVTNTPGTIINWRGFSVGADEAARFQQQSAASSVLNRVTGQDPSAILGKLQSNGRVFVINPNGIVFGPGAQIDVAGLVASSLHLSDADFLSGRLQFREQGKAGAVVNQGEIRTPSGGRVYLVAPRVENHGLVTTPDGDIVLAAGKKIEIVDVANPSVRIEVAAPENEALNVGKLVATSGRVNLVGGTLRITGKVSADAAVVENGRIAFRRTATPARTEVAGAVNLRAEHSLTVEPVARVSADGPVAGQVTLQAGGDLALQADSSISATGAIGGTVSAKAETGMLLAQGAVEARGEDGPGGQVRFQGNRIALLQRSRVDASGADGGGVVLVGGGYQGSDPAMQNAQRTVVAPGAEIRADATRSGNGGTVVLWSEESTRFHGAISARGAGEGAGGLVETSGKQHLDFAGRVDVSAQSARGGTLLLDPLNINLTTTDANTAGFNAPGDIQALFADDAGLTSNFNVNAGGSFNGIAAGSNIVLQATNNITASTAFNITAATGNADVSLTLQANNSIAINAAITTSGTGNLTLVADNDDAGGGAISRTAAGTLGVGPGGAITLNASTGLNASVSAPSVSVTNRTSGTVTVTNTLAGGNIAFSGNSAATTLAATASNGAMTQDGTLTVSGTSTLNAGGAGTVTLANTANNFGTVTVTSARDVTLADTNAVILGASTLSGNLSVTTANGAITQSGTLVVPGTSNFQAGTANITLATATNNFNVVEASGQALSLRDANTMTLGNVAATGALTVVTNGTLNQGAGSTVRAAGTTTLTAGAGNDITLDGSTNNFNVLRVVSGRNVGITDANGLSFGVGTSTVSGNLALNANGSVTQSAALVVAGTANLQAGGGDIVLTTATNNFNTVVAAGQAVSLRDTNTMTLGNVSATGALTLQTNGALAQSANTVVTAGGNTTLTAPTTGDITLANAGNDFNNVRIVSGRNVQITDVDDLAFAGGASAVSGTLAVTANGAVTQASSLSVTGVASFNTGSSDLTLGNTANAFSTVSIAAAGNATLYEAGGFALGNSTVSNNLTVTSTGAITDTGNIVVPGRLAVETRNNTAQAITLDSAGNNFGSVSAQTLNGAGAAVVAGAITLREASAMELAQLRTTGAANLTTGGHLTQSGTVSVGTTLTANVGSANDITLANTANNFGTVTVTSARDVTLADANAIAIGASTLNGALSVTSANNTITVSGNVSTAAANGAISFNAGTGTYVQNANIDVAAGSGNITVAANVLTLNTNAGNNALQTSGTLTLRPGTTAQAMSVAGASAFDVSAAELNAFMPGLNNAGGSLVVGRSDSAAAMTIGAATNFGTGSKVTLAAGSITDANNVRTLTADALTLYANSGNIGGAGANNAIDVAAANLVVGANNQNAYVRSAAGLNFGAATSNLGSGSLVATAANGAITQGAAIVATGAGTTFNAGSAAITLGNASNDFGTVTVAAANQVTIADANAITLNVPALAGGIGVSTGGSATVTSSAALQLRASTVLGALTASANGAITQSGALSVTGAATFNSGANALTLSNAGNDFSSVQVASSGNASITDANAMALAGANVNGTLQLKTSGNLTQTGALVASGTVTLDAGATGNATLTHSANNFASVTVTAANDVSLVDTNAIDLGAFSVNGAISVAAGGNVSLSGVLQAAGAGNAIVLSAGGNFLNNSGASALSTSSGRWLVYSSDPALNAFGGLASGNAALWSRTYAANAPASIPQSGNRYLFSTGRTLTVTAASFAKTYGDDVSGGTSSAYTVSGLNTNTYGGAILADTAAGALTGLPQVVSSGAAAGASVSGSPYAMSLGTGTLATPTGYALSVTGSGQLTVQPAPLTVSADGFSRRQAEPNPPFTASYSGFRNGEGTSALGGSLQFATDATLISPPGDYSLTPSGLTAANYTITFVAGTIRVGKAFYAGDPLQGAHNALFAPSTAGLAPIRPTSSGSIPTFVLAEADLPFAALLRTLPPTAAGPQADVAPSRRPPGACDDSTPFGLLRCRAPE